MKKNYSSYLLLGSTLPALSVVLTSCGSNETAKKEMPSKPNVIVILADDMGYGDLSVNGSTEISTPNLDRLANEGINFCNGYATSATSTPSRYAMFTGMYPWKNPRAKILAGDAPLLIGVDQYTMPKMMQKAGYTTAAIGKWHLGMGNGNVNWNETVTPGAKEVGFDYSCLIAATNDRVPTVFVENGDVVGLEKDDPIYVNYKENFEGEPTALTNPEMLKMKWAHGHNNSIVNGIPRIGYMKGGEKAKWVDENMADYFVGLVKNFVSENKEKPFFLYYGLHQPHVPRTPNARFVGSTKLGPRGDAVVEADWCVGELIKQLEQDGLLENTIIFYSSDNGHVLNDGYLDGAVDTKDMHDPAGGYRGGKYSLYSGGTHVPFMVYWKGQIQPMKSSAFVSQLDIFASVAELINGEIPEGLDSENHLETFLGKSQEGRESYIFEANSKIGLRKGNYTLIPPYTGPKSNLTDVELGNDLKPQLYDMSNDPFQTKNLAEEKPELTASLLEEFKATAGEFYQFKTKEMKLK